MFLPLITYFINLLTILLPLCSYNQRFKDKTKTTSLFSLDNTDLINKHAEQQQKK